MKVWGEPVVFLLNVWQMPYLRASSLGEGEWILKPRSFFKLFLF